ncbi:MAG: hypothetical protein JOY54_05385 [Acidobacteriaceae bacterium]|nr:hypothetical protein [Acidobacteriaceae bacterium]
MPRSFEPRAQEAPLYVRWPPERSRYAVELRLDLVPRLSAELAKAAQQGTEIGGVLLGFLLNSPSPTMRIEGLELLPRRPEEGPVFLLDPAQVQHFQQLCQSARIRQHAVLGLFRTHLRQGPVQPSIADRSLLSQQFGHGPHALLLIQGLPPHLSTFFVAMDGQLPPQPAVAEFRFDEAAFKALPEVPAEEPVAPTRPLRRQTPASRRSLVWLLGLAILVAASFIWQFLRQPVTATSSLPSNQIGLALSPAGGLLRISWNHASRAISRARGATLNITDGSRRVQMTLGSADLKLGSVAYQNTSPQVSVSMTLDAPGLTLPAQSASWPAK